MPSIRPTRAELFLAFMKIGVSAFGGALPWAQRILVDEKKWIEPKEFVQMLTLCQAVPGPNIVNLSVLYGSRLYGVPGALICFVGVLGMPLIIMLSITSVYRAYAEVPQVKSALVGITAVAVAFMLAQCAKLAKPYARNPWGAGLAIAAVVAAIALHWSVAIILFAGGVIGALFAWKGKL